MKIKCEYCNNYMEDSDAFCESCGAANKNIARFANGVPRTISELKNFAVMHNLPLESMHIYIGENYPYPKAFGIYQEANGDFVVYKNKADGTRAIRYSGPDEAYAVNELYLKMKDMVMTGKSANITTSGVYIPVNNAYKSRPTHSGRKRPLGPLITFFIVFGIIFFLCIFMGIIGAFSNNYPDKGYYHYHGDDYYYDGHDWYVYDDYYDDWAYAGSVDSRLYDNYDSFFISSYYSGTYDFIDFFDSDYYYYDYDYDYDYDDSWDDDWDDSDWDWDSSYDYDWDSGSDWDSDW